jgi:hypothetical protein
VTDIFGNAYPVIVSAPTLVQVMVSNTKFSKLGYGRASVSIGLSFLAAAAIASQVPPYGWVAAIIFAATGMALIIAGTFLLYEAYDPPIPDFRDREAALPDPRAWNIPSVDDETLHPLRTLALLVARLVSAQVRANHLKDRAWASFVDRDEPAWRQRRDGARDELETLRRLVPATFHAADEAHEKWEQLLGEVRSLPTPESLRDMTRRFADELGLIDKERALIDKLLETLDERELRRALERTRADGLRTIGELVRRIHEATASEFAECEYLR